MLLCDVDVLVVFFDLGVQQELLNVEDQEFEDDVVQKEVLREIFIGSKVFVVVVGFVFVSDCGFVIFGDEIDFDYCLVFQFLYSQFDGDGYYWVDLLQLFIVEV